MKKLMKIRNLAIICALASAMLANAARASTRYSIDAHCEGAFEVYVVDWSGYGSALYVYDGDDLLLAEWVEETTGGTSSTTYTYYKTEASPLDGGASLRIRTVDTRIPAAEGTAHLTIVVDGRAQNRALTCDEY